MSRCPDWPNPLSPPAGTDAMQSLNGLEPYRRRNDRHAGGADSECQKCPVVIDRGTGRSSQFGGSGSGLEDGESLAVRRGKALAGTAKRMRSLGAGKRCSGVVHGDRVAAAAASRTPQQ